MICIKGKFYFTKHLKWLYLQVNAKSRTISLYCSLLLFCVPIWIKFEFGNKEKVKFSWFCVTRDIWNISSMNEKYDIKANVLQTIKRLLIGHFWTIEMNMLTFRDKLIKRLIKTCHFFEILHRTYYRTCTAKFILIVFTYFWNKGTFCCFPDL